MKALAAVGQVWTGCSTGTSELSPRAGVSPGGAEQKGKFTSCLCYANFAVAASESPLAFREKESRDHSGTVYSIFNCFMAKNVPEHFLRGNSEQTELFWEVPVGGTSSRHRVYIHIHQSQSGVKTSRLLSVSENKNKRWSCHRKNSPFFNLSFSA